MPSTPYFSITYPTPLDPATDGLWAPILNALFDDVDEGLGRCVITGCIPSPEAGFDYAALFYSRFPLTINRIRLKTDAGTLTANVKINSTSIGGMSAISVTGTETTTSASGSNTVAATNSVYLNLSSVSSTTGMLYYSIWADRTAAGTA